MKSAITLLVGLAVGLGFGPGDAGTTRQLNQAGDQHSERQNTNAAALRAKKRLAVNLRAIVLIKVSVGGRKGHGTGVVIDPKRRLVLTNAHVVRIAAANGDRVIVQLRNGIEVPATVVARAAGGLDLALIQLDAQVQAGAANIIRPKLTGVKVSCAMAKAPEQVMAIGHPGPFRWTVSRGHVAGVFTKAKNLGRSLVLDLTIWHGNSGGGLFDAKGRLIGITTAIFGQRTMYSRTYSGFSFAISGPDMCGFLAGEKKKRPIEVASAD